jgi:hypothetical protein
VGFTASQGSIVAAMFNCKSMRCQLPALNVFQRS